MRYMLILKGDPPPGAEPPPELIDGMQRYSEELADAGVLLSAEGLHDSSYGARVVYAKGRRTVLDGPFTETKELIAGFYLIEVKSREEAVEWAKRCPVHLAVQGDMEAVVEVRQVAEVVDVSTFTDEQRAAEQALRDRFRPA